MKLKKYILSSILATITLTSPFSNAIEEDTIYSSESDVMPNSSFLYSNPTKVLIYPTEGIKLCINCHGDEGRMSRDDIPLIQGQNENYLAKQLTAFKYGTRKNPDMNSVAAYLTDKDILELAQYFSKNHKKDYMFLDK